uniref:PH domain-containing protein n=1 Tax=Panagrellus redivivus TaxID=6233 RepID=A0A7E4V494_PANRE
MSVLNVKDGYVKKYKPTLMGGKWKDRYLRLSSDSSLCWFDHSRDSYPSGRIILKDVIPYICVGQMVNTIPVARPPLPWGTTIDNVVAIGTGVQGMDVHWFLFANDYDLESWFKQILATLPKPTVPAPPNPNASYPEPPPPYTETVQSNPVPLPRGAGVGYHNRPVPPPVPQRTVAAPAPVQHIILTSNNQNRDILGLGSLMGSLAAAGMGAFYLAKKQIRPPGGLNTLRPNGFGSALMPRPNRRYGCHCAHRRNRMCSF